MLEVRKDPSGNELGIVQASLAGTLRSPRGWQACLELQQAVEEGLPISDEGGEHLWVTYQLLRDRWELESRRPQ